MNRGFAFIVGEGQEARASGIVVGVGRQFRNPLRRIGLLLLPLSLRHGPIIALTASPCGGPRQHTAMPDWDNAVTHPLSIPRAVPMQRANIAVLGVPPRRTVWRETMEMDFSGS